jgi:hypothetical protein
MVCGVIASAFVAGGFLPLTSAVFAVHGYWRTRAEVTVAANLESVELKRTSGGRGRGGLYTKAQSRYEVDGRQFRGTRVALFKKTAGFHDRLSSAYASGRPIRVFIDPQRPDYAVIDREYSWWPGAVAAPFGLIFIGVGTFLLLHVLQVLPRQRTLRVER